MPLLWLMLARQQALCFLRPTGENVAALRRHLRKPKFGEYHICACASSPRLAGADTCAAVFSNMLRESFLHELAEADDGELVKQIQARAAGDERCQDHV